MSIDHCFDFFSSLRLTANEQHIARDVLKEIRERLEFLMNVGLNYLTLNRLRLHAVWRRIPKNSAGNSDWLESDRGALCS